LLLLLIYRQTCRRRTAVGWRRSGRSRTVWGVGARWGGRGRL